MVASAYFNQGMQGQCDVCIKRWVVTCVCLACGIMPGDVQVLYGIDYLLYHMLLSSEVPLSLKASKLILHDVCSDAILMCCGIYAIQPCDATPQ